MEQHHVSDHARQACCTNHHGCMPATLDGHGNFVHVTQMLRIFNAAGRWVRCHAKGPSGVVDSLLSIISSTSTCMPPSRSIGPDHVVSHRYRSLMLGLPSIGSLGAVKVG